MITIRDNYLRSRKVFAANPRGILPHEWVDSNDHAVGEHYDSPLYYYHGPSSHWAFIKLLMGGGV